MNVVLGQFFPGTSVLHRLDPRTKLLLTLVLIVCIFLVRGFLGYGVLFLFILLAARESKVRLKTLFKAVRPILFIIALTVVLNVFFATGGTVLVRWSFVTITKEGLINSAYMALRLILLVLGTQLLTLTTSPISLTDGLERLMSPLRRLGFPAHELAMMMSIALRFIPTLTEEADKIIKAQKARGADFESGSLVKRARAMLPILVPLFVSAFRRADELALAMEARCYRGGEHRTRMRILRFTRLDTLAFGLTGLVLALGVWLPV